MKLRGPRSLNRFQRFVPSTLASGVRPTASFRSQKSFAADRISGTKSQFMGRSLELVVPHISRSDPINAMESEEVGKVEGSCHGFDLFCLVVTSRTS